MKRIDDKIKEIEKKDKTNRWAYYIIVLILAGFLVYVSTTRKQIDLKDAQIDSLVITQTKIYKDLDSTNKQNKKLYEDLKNSLDPQEYWNSINSDHSVESYIDYITNDWGISKPYLQNAKDSVIKLNTEHANEFQGWLFVGALNDGIFTPDDEDFFEIVWRENASGDIKKSQPVVGDIIKLIKGTNRLTYAKHKGKSKKEFGWRIGTKAFVVDTWDDPNSTNYEIKIKYY